MEKYERKKQRNKEGRITRKYFVNEQIAFSKIRLS